MTTRDASLPPEPLPLTEASVQEIQLFRNHDQLALSLGTSEPGFVVSFWWD